MEIVLKSDKLKFREVALKLEKNRVIAFIGYNATLKSLVARAILSSLIDRAADVKMREIVLRVFERSLLRYRELFQIEVAGEVESPLLPLLVEDSRLALRAYLADIREPLEALIDSLASRQRSDRELEEVLSTLEDIRHRLSMLDTYVMMKQYIDSGLLKKVLTLEEEELKKTADQGVSSEEVVPLALHVEPGERVRIFDRRLKEEVQAGLASSAVASALLWSLVELFFSIPASSRVLVIEEPEEAMAPIQQVAFMRVLRRLAAEVGGANYVIVTTHSPYIAALASRPLLHFEYKEGVFRVEETDLPRSFVLADILMLQEG